MELEKLKKTTRNNSYVTVLSFAYILLVYFFTASFAPQTEHFQSEVILGCSLTSAPKRPHLGIISPAIFQFRM